MNTSELLYGHVDECVLSSERGDAMTFLDERSEALSGADSAVSLMAREQYFRELAWMVPLSSEERDTFLRRVIRGNGERSESRPNQWVLSLARHARESLVEAYQPLVIGLARRRMFLFKSMELLDVIQEGNLGLLEALDRYDEEKARVVEFGAFATRCIKTALAAAVNERDVFIRLSWRTHNFVTRKKMVAAELRKHLGRQPLLSEVAEVMEVAEETLQHVLKLAERREVGSLHAMLEKRDIPEDATSFVSLYTSAVVAEDTRQQELAETFERVFAIAMPEQQREVLQLRYGFGDVAGTSIRPAELVSEMIGLPGREHVSSSEHKATQRLRALLEPVALPDGRLSCTFEDVYTEEYCTSREAAELLDVSLSCVDSFVQRGLLFPELRSRPHICGAKVRYFKKADVLALQQKRAAAPVKISSRRRESASLKQARRSASLPAIVA